VQADVSQRGHLEQELVMVLLLPPLQVLKPPPIAARLHPCKEVRAGAEGRGDCKALITAVSTPAPAPEQLEFCF
jgi:hypothetical protein